MARRIGPAVVGIDPSLSATGLALADGSTVTVQNRKITGDKRLVHLYLSVYNAVLLADFAVIEDLPTHAKSAGLTGRSQGVVRLALQQADVPYVALPPATLKKAATGKGNADKAAMLAALPAEVGEVIGKDDNQADAWWLRQCGLKLLDEPNLLAHLTASGALEAYASDPIVMAMREVWRD